MLFRSRSILRVFQVQQEAQRAVLRQRVQYCTNRIHTSSPSYIYVCYQAKLACTAHQARQMIRAQRSWVLQCEHATAGVSKRSKRFREQIIDAEPSNDWKTGTGSASSYAAFEDQGANLLAPIKTETVDEGNDSDVPQSPSKRPRRACCAPARLHDHVIGAHSVRSSW